MEQRRIECRCLFTLALIYVAVNNLKEGTVVDRPCHGLKVGDAVIVLGGKFEGLCASVVDLVSIGSRIEYAVSIENGHYAVYQRSELALLKSSPAEE